MRDQHRLREQGATAAEKILLDSSRNDGPPEGAARQLLASLHLSGGQGAGNGLPHAGTEAAPGATGAASGAAWIKVGGLALAALVGLGVAGVVVRSRAGKHPLARPMLSSELAQPPTPRAAAALREPDQLAAPLAPSDAPETGPPQRSEARQIRKPVPTEASLAAELRFLDVARVAVDAHEMARAQQALDGYRRRFPHGRLKPEATVLRLAVWIQQGNIKAARSLGARLLADDAYRAYQTRIRSLLHDGGSDQTADPAGREP